MIALMEWHTVFCLIKNNRLLAFKDLIGHFHLGQTEFFMDLFTDCRIQIMESRQAMHKDGCILGIGKCLGIDLIWKQVMGYVLPRPRSARP